MFTTLKECRSFISKLNLSFNQLDDECMQALGEYAQDNDYLQKLEIGCNNITDKGFRILYEHLIGNVKLKELNIERNGGITNISAPNLADMAKKTCITNINFWFTSITEKNFETIRVALQIPIEKREIPIKSKSKSAAKIDYASSST